MKLPLLLALILLTSANINAEVPTATPTTTNFCAGNECRYCYIPLDGDGSKFCHNCSGDKFLSDKHSSGYYKKCQVPEVRDPNCEGSTVNWKDSTENGCDACRSYTIPTEYKVENGISWKKCLPPYDPINVDVNCLIHSKSRVCIKCPPGKLRALIFQPNEQQLIIETASCLDLPPDKIIQNCEYYLGLGNFPGGVSEVQCEGCIQNYDYNPTSKTCVPYTTDLNGCMRKTVNPLSSTGFRCDYCDYRGGYFAIDADP